MIDQVTPEDAELEKVVAYIRRHWRSGNGALIKLLEGKAHRNVPVVVSKDKS